MELYKYCESKHLRDAKQSGSVRIGTLFDYRQTAKYGEFVSDEHEGKKVMGGTIRNITDSSKYPWMEELIKVENSSIGEMTIDNITIHSNNLMIFSASTSYDGDMHRRWLEEENYDACYCITSARLFFRAITKALGDEYRFLGAGFIIYTDKIDISHPNANVHPALVKRHSKFEDQGEFRGVWEKTTIGDCKPLILDRSDVSRYLHEHKYL